MLFSPTKIDIKPKQKNTIIVKIVAINMLENMLKNNDKKHKKNRKNQLSLIVVQNAKHQLKVLVNGMFQAINVFFVIANIKENIKKQDDRNHQL
jgi:hypothetical protein